MSTFYQQKFISPEPLFAEVKETLRSYFDSGIIDDMMFPKWTEHCLRRFRKAAYKIEQTILHIDDYMCKLPDNFNAVREAWACSTHWSQPIQSPSSYYYQTDCRMDTVAQINCHPCKDYEQQILDVAKAIACDPCKDQYRVTHKVTDHEVFTFSFSHLLRPGNINAQRHCGDHCQNMFSSNPNSFDIRDGHFITNFSYGHVYLMYYADTAEDIQLIPENFWVEDYIRKYLIYKCFEQISHLVTDETFNQIQIKLAQAEQKQAEAFVSADIELKKETVDQKFRAIKRSYNINRKYNIR